jgi:hypothetical protein
MKPNTENLKKALKACAEAHCTEFFDWSEGECQVALKKESVPVLSDVKMICEAFYGRSSMVETGWGYTTVYLDEGSFLDKVDGTLISLALPKNVRL